MARNDGAPADYLGLFTDSYEHYGTRGQRVYWLAWDSPAQGLEIGDVVLEVAAGDAALRGAAIPRVANPFSGTSALWAALNTAPGATLSLRVLRGDTAHTVNLDPLARP
ncbi:MAG: hypothetical protein AAGD86_14820 [Pseudomonadota bacterium]